jgi:hypothetical protein
MDALGWSGRTPTTRNSMCARRVVAHGGEFRQAARAASRKGRPPVERPALPLPWPPVRPG